MNLFNSASENQIFIKLHFTYFFRSYKKRIGLQGYCHKLISYLSYNTSIVIIWLKKDQFHYFKKTVSINFVIFGLTIFYFEIFLFLCSFIYLYSFFFFQSNVLPSSASAEVNLRIHPAQTIEEVSLYTAIKNK